MGIDRTVAAASREPPNAAKTALLIASQMVFEKVVARVQLRIPLCAKEPWSTVQVNGTRALPSATRFKISEWAVGQRRRAVAEFGYVRWL